MQLPVMHTEAQIAYLGAPESDLLKRQKQDIPEKHIQSTNSVTCFNNNNNNHNQVFYS
jgi:hypothetical protein